MNRHHLLLLLLIALHLAPGGAKPSPPIPNPFEGAREFALQYRQCIESEAERLCHLVDEWLSLDSGLSLSKFRDEDGNNNGSQFGLLADGSSGRFYLLQSGQNQNLSRCLPDQWHLHRQLFPWHCMERRLYGVAAIWLNAIQRKLTPLASSSSSSSLVDSAPPETIWRLRADRPPIEVEFRQDKTALAGSLLKSIQIHERSVYSRTQNAHKVSVFGQRRISIEILGLKPADHNQAGQVSDLLLGCRTQTHLIEPMPSMAGWLAAAQSPGYTIQYVRRHLTTKRTASVFVTDSFDFGRRSQLTSYLALGQVGAKIENVFRRQFEQQACTEHHYLRQDGQVSRCWRNQLQAPLESRRHRRLRFAEPERAPADGWLDGMGALLLAAADVLAEDMQLSRQLVHVPAEPLEATSTCSVGHSASVWRWLEGERELSFYFKLATNSSPQMEQLIRVESREASGLVRYDISSLSSLEALDSAAHFALPDLCTSAPIELGGPSGVRLPAYADFASYSASYTVVRRHFGQQAPVKVSVREQVDAVGGQSKFVLTHLDDLGFVSELYLDWASRLALNYEPMVTHVCSRVSSLSQLVDFGELAELVELEDERQLHGLARLWVQLHRLGDFDRRQGDTSDRQTFTLDRASSSGGRLSVLAEFQLVAGETYRPARISVAQTSADNHTESVEVSVDSMDSASGGANDIRLPDECAALKAKLTSELQWPAGAADDKRGFPRLSSLIRPPASRLYLRGQVSCHLADYLIDEWASEGDFRLRSSGLERELDLLVYGDTGELFDLSQPFECPTAPPASLLGATDCNQSRFLELLADERTAPAKLADLYYSPLLLWLLAERSSVATKLERVFFLVPQPERLRLPAHFGLDLGQEVWQVEGPAGAWKYRLHFERAGVAGSGGWLATSDHRLLSKIEILHDDNPALAGRNLLISVISLRQPTPAELAAKLRLPEGHNCRRKEGVVAEDGDLFELELGEKLQRLHYEASLLAEAENSDRQLALPALSGSFVPALGPRGVAVHRARSRSPAGAWHSERLVQEAGEPQMYRLDEASGHCGRVRAARNLWQLQFGPNLTVELDEQLVATLFGPAPAGQLHLINRYSSGASHLSVYERRLDNLRLFGERRCASLVRVLSRSQQASSPEMSVRLVLFHDEQPKRVWRELRVVLRRQEIQLAELVRESNVAQCYNEASWIQDRQLHSFHLGYQLQGAGESPTEEAVQAAFLQSLVHSWSLSPLQLVGPPRVELSVGGRRAGVEFELVEGPTAAERFTRMFSTRMAPALEARALMATAASLAQCSSWCDQLAAGCRAMSFCSDRSCLLLAAGLLDRHKLSLTDSVVDEHCVHFYLMSSRAAPTVRQLASSLESAISGDRTGAELAKFTLNLSAGSSLEPLTFAQVQKGLDSATDWLLDSQSSTFTLYRSNRWLEASRPADFETALELGDCLAKCPECSLVSFCKRTGDCATLGSSWLAERELGELTDELQVERLGCSVYTRNHLLEYEQFRDTRAHEQPAALLVLAGSSELECSAACSRRQDTCRSFDFCAPTADGDDSQTLCLLLAEHISLDTFNRSLLVADNSSQQLTCDHYSRSQLASYERLADRQFGPQTGGLLVGGAGAERCALECRQDERCLAFEHCQRPEAEPVQSCTFSADNLAGGSLTEPSSECSVYLWRSEQVSLGKEAAARASARPPHLWAILALLVVVVLLSSCLQLAYLQLSGGGGGGRPRSASSG